MKFARIQDGLIFELFTADDGHYITYYFGDFGVWAAVDPSLDPQPEQNWTAVQGDDGGWTFAAALPPQPTEADVRRKRFTLLDESDWVMLRHRDQVAVGGPTFLSEGAYRSWLDYRQALRDVPKQPGFPVNVEWPAAPSE
ncbi:tail fiber assembly protein [Luteibacter sp.]|jgi:hypothetical protein|uniref:tail fiber assembly protein n=1 Tax=Luteibacter sp. TaxID=1886636 RepID=UPI002F427404